MTLALGAALAGVLAGLLVGFLAGRAHAHRPGRPSLDDLLFFHTMTPGGRPTDHIGRVQPGTVPTLPDPGVRTAPGLRFNGLVGRPDPAVIRQAIQREIARELARQITRRTR